MLNSFGRRLCNRGWLSLIMSMTLALSWTLFSQGSFLSRVFAAPPAQQAIDVEAFVREGCPHCAAAEAFLAKLARERPELRIALRDVGKEPAALVRLEEIAKAQRTDSVRVPAFFVRGQLIAGFSPAASTDKLILAALASKSAATNPAQVAEGAATCDSEERLSCTASPGAEPGGLQFEVTIFGREISLDDVGMPLFTLIMGLLDGFNPCSMWVLILMISLLAPLNSRSRMVAIAGTFVLIQGIVYYLFMAAWLNLFLFVGLSRASELIIASIAILAGMINLKDFLALGRGISLSIPDAAKPGIYTRMRAILRADNLTAALIATIVLGLLVQLVELLCTSGFPALFTRILTLRQSEGASYYGYLLLYNAAYMLDDVIVLTIGVITLSRRRLQEKEGRWLKLISGLAMVGLGVYLIFGT
jgi:glutaredoxin